MITVRAFGATSALVATKDLTVYDACYLELALRLGLPLASLDKELCQAALTCGVRLAASWLAGIAVRHGNPVLLGPQCRGVPIISPGPQTMSGVKPTGPEMSWRMPHARRSRHRAQASRIIMAPRRGCA
jgi:hypothetical protein